MAYIINSNSCECFPNYSTSTFLPCCNAPVVLDSTYQARHFQEVYYAPEPAPEIQVVRQRLPDPPPDVIERVVVVPQPKKYVYQVVEVPTKPPPVVQQRVVHQAPNPTLCGGTYRVQVPHGSVANAPKLVQSASYMQGSPLIQQAPMSYGSSSTIQQAPISYGSPSFMTL